MGGVALRFCLVLGRILMVDGSGTALFATENMEW